MSHEQGSVLTHDVLVERGLAAHAARLLVDTFYPTSQSGPGRQALELTFAGDQGLLASVDESGDVTGAVVVSTPEMRLSRGGADLYAPDEARLSLIAVAETSRRSGVGDMLLRVAEAIAVEGGARRMTLTVPASPSGIEYEELTRFYGNRGYTPDTNSSANGYVKSLSLS